MGLQVELRAVVTWVFLVLDDFHLAVRQRMGGFIVQRTVAGEPSTYFDSQDCSHDCTCSLGIEAPILSRTMHFK